VIVYLATRNAGKVREMEELLAGSGITPALEETYASPLEGDASYADNAALKARALWAQLRRDGRPGHVLADDSGLEVAALGGRPGVTTADYGGSGLGWAERRRLLLADVEASGARTAAERRARFVCALHFIGEGGRELATMASVDGVVPPEERGALGFSFDPVFLYEPAGLTFAEMPAGAKNAVSHRAVAVAGLLAMLRVARTDVASVDVRAAAAERADPSAVRTDEQ